jgi:hypothetical protein
MKPNTEAIWAERIEEWDRSGQSATEFADVASRKSQSGIPWWFLLARAQWVVGSRAEAAITFTSLGAHAVADVDHAGNHSPDLIGSDAGSWS